VGTDYEARLSPGNPVPSCHWAPPFSQILSSSKKDIVTSGLSPLTESLQLCRQDHVLIRSLLEKGLFSFWCSRSGTENSNSLTQTNEYAEERGPAGGS
jgi:hypothetical protein